MNDVKMSFTLNKRKCSCFLVYVTVRLPYLRNHETSRSTIPEVLELKLHKTFLLVFS